MNIHKYKGASKGFTLIELLVVIAIIGILSAVVLASLNTARSKGSDAAIMADMDGIRTQAGIYNNDHNGYGPVLADVESNCAAADNLFSEGTVQNQIAGVNSTNVNANMVCNVSADGTEYAVSAALVAAENQYYCVDSTGVATTTFNALEATDTVCS